MRQGANSGVGEPAWLAGLREGRPQDREAFVAATLPQVVGWCNRLSGPGVDGEDVAHEVMLIALDKAHALGPEPNIQGWLFAITRRVLANYRRRAWVKRIRDTFGGPDAFVDKTSNPEQALGARQRADLARACLDQLSRRHREVLVLYDLEERSAREVGELLDIREDAVRALVMRARRNLKRAARKAGYRPDGKGLE